MPAYQDADYEQRLARVNINIGLATAGDKKAWYTLGAIGSPAVPLPLALSNPYFTNITAPQGWTAAPWGSSYNPIRTKARQAYVALSGNFAYSPVSGGPLTETTETLGGGSPPVSGSPAGQMPFTPGGGSACSTCAYNPNQPGPVPLGPAPGTPENPNAGPVSSAPTTTDTAEDFLAKAKGWPWWVWLLVLLVILLILRGSK